MGGFRWLLWFTMALEGFAGSRALAAMPDPDSPALPAVGFYQLNIITPALLELTFITGEGNPLTREREWEFVTRTGELHLPSPGQLSVSNGSARVAVKR